MKNPNTLRIHITGASGSGTTTLGAALCESLGLVHLDTDDFYWLPTPIPFTEKRPIPERLSLMQSKMLATSCCVLSGSFVSWGQPLEVLLDVVIFLQVPTPVRMSRLEQREFELYGAAIEVGGAQFENYTAFMHWAAGYDDGDGQTRSLIRHEAWLDTLSCPILRLGDLSVDARVAAVNDFLHAVD